MKQRARIIDKSNTLIEKHRAGPFLISTELIQCCAGLYHLLKGWKSSKSPVDLSDIRLFIPA
jgi:hypothetical protein